MSETHIPAAPVDVSVETVPLSRLKYSAAAHGNWEKPSPSNGSEYQNTLIAPSESRETGTRLPIGTMCDTLASSIRSDSDISESGNRARRRHGALSE
jgi:hypothetical protein